MDLIKALRETCVCIDLKSDTKEGVIGEMIDLMVSDGSLAAALREPARQSVMEREEKLSTGVQHGVAMPHGKTDAVDGFVTAIALKKDGIDFGAVDGRPSRIFVMTVSSALRAADYMQFLGGISRLLNSADIRARVLGAASREELIEVLTKAV